MRAAILPAWSSLNFFMTANPKAAPRWRFWIPSALCFSFSIGFREDGGGSSASSCALTTAWVPAGRPREPRGQSLPHPVV